MNAYLWVNRVNSFSLTSSFDAMTRRWACFSCVQLRDIKTANKQSITNWKFPTVVNAAADMMHNKRLRWHQFCQRSSSLTPDENSSKHDSSGILAIGLGSFRWEMSGAYISEDDTDACPLSELKQGLSSACKIWRIDIWKLPPFRWYHPNWPFVGSDKHARI